MELICSRCGCTSFHYNHGRRRLECDSCGAPVREPQENQQLMEYYRAYSQAMDHLCVGNWERAIDLLKPLVEQHPTDTHLYKALLKAATQDYSDITMLNTARRTLAANAWSKLERLNGITSTMLSYRSQWVSRRRKELCRQRNRILAWVFASALLCFIAGDLIDSGRVFVAVLCASGAVFCLNQMLSLNPANVIRQLRSPAPAFRSNPFV